MSVTTLIINYDDHTVSLLQDGVPIERPSAAQLNAAAHPANSLAMSYPDLSPRGPSRFAYKAAAAAAPPSPTPRPEPPPAKPAEPVKANLVEVRYNASGKAVITADGRPVDANQVVFFRSSQGGYCCRLQRAEGEAFASVEAAPEPAKPTSPPAPDVHARHLEVALDVANKTVAVTADGKAVQWESIVISRDGKEGFTCGVRQTPGSAYTMVRPRPEAATAGQADAAPAGEGPSQVQSDVTAFLQGRRGKRPNAPVEAARTPERPQAKALDAAPTETPAIAQDVAELFRNGWRVDA